MNQTHALANVAHQTGEGLRLSAAPPDVIQPVVAVGQGVAARQAIPLGDDSAADKGLRVSAPPEDIIQPVQVVSQAFSNTAQTPAAVGSDAAKADLPTSLKEFDYSEEMGEAADSESQIERTDVASALSNEAIYRIIREVAAADSGDELYSAISPDREYETAGHQAAGSRHFGLGFGLVLFTQESGRLGSVLRLMHRRDPTTFAEIFGAEAESLLATTNAATSDERLKPVGGAPLWSAAWIERFRRAGTVATFQAAQNEAAIEEQFRPMLKVAFELGLVTDRALAMVYDRVVTRGLGGGLRWVVQAAGPLRTAAQRAHAIEMLGFKDVSQFQTTTDWTPRDGRFGPETHAALVGALRRQGNATLPTTDDLVARLAASAMGSAKQRLVRLRDSTSFQDAVFGLG